MIELDREQAAACKTESRSALVIAGAGSGKTRVLTERIAYLIEHKGVSPYEVLAFTFTRKAAGELKSRLAERLGRDARHLNIGTIHSYALRLIHAYGDLIGYFRPAGLTVYSDWEANYLLKEIATELGVYNGKTWKPGRKVIDSLFSKYYSEGVEPEPHAPGAPVFRDFNYRCKENVALTYGALIVKLFELLYSTNLPIFLPTRHIFLDEAQDTDPLQWKIISKLREITGATLFAVGDPDQSVYSFRGACPAYLVDNQILFDVYKLENNYRSAPAIVEASNNLIEHNTCRIPKTMRAARPHTDPMLPPLVNVLENQDSEALAKTIAEGYTGGKTCAVLCRVHILLDKLAPLLKERGLPVQLVGSQSALLNSEGFRRTLAYLKLIVNPRDNFSFLLIRKDLKISDQTYSEIRFEAIELSMSHFEIWVKTLNFDYPVFIDPPKTLGEALVLLHNSCPWINFDTAKFLEDFKQDNPGAGIVDLLDYVATSDIQDEVKAEEDLTAIRLMTVHAAKGLEFSKVYVAGCNEGIMPHKRALSDPGEMEEERRIAYVAITRAEDQVTLCVRPKVTESEGRSYVSPASRFIHEIYNQRGLHGRGLPIPQHGKLA